MSRDPYRPDRYVPPPRFHALEREVLAALAWENDHIVADLAGQVEEALPGHRRNTGQGFHHEIIVDRARPPPKERVTGLFGTVHALIDGLEGAVLFQIELREGRLIALVADSYGQPTAHIDFQTVGYEQVFWIDVNGNSQPFEPAVLIDPKPAWERADWSPPMDRPMPAILAVRPANPPRTLERAVREDQGRGLEDAVFEAVSDWRAQQRPSPARRSGAVSPADLWVVKLGLWAAIATIVLFCAVVLDWPLGVVGIIGWLLAGLAARKQLLYDLAGWLAVRRGKAI